MEKLLRKHYILTDNCLNNYYLLFNCIFCKILLQKFLLINQKKRKGFLYFFITSREILSFAFLL